ncbi:MAG: helix-hairpin-helix domain-containing protein [Ignavibacteria bacterium]|nr:helix-hairpin-helix domain-containing protein [Ignavibacteria bacterium]
MRFENLKNKIKSSLGIADAEFFVVLIIALGLLIGVSYKLFFSDIQYNLESRDEVFNTLDSLAEVNKNTFVGSNIEDEANPKLVTTDSKTKYKSKKDEFKGKININTANKKQLQKLYRIGEKTAEKIIEYRTKTPFKKKEDIMKVRGIGKQTYEKIKDNIEI